MRTWRMTFNPKKQKNSVFCQYFLTNTTDARRMYNTANFYIRNTMTGIKKSPELRTPNEVEVLHDVFTGIQKANKARNIKYQKDLEKYNKGLSEKQPKEPKYFPYPTTKEWFLTYNVLDAVFKYTHNEVYYSMNSQLNQNAIRKAAAAWKGYFKTLKDYRKNPSKYKERPNMPGYLKNPQYVAWFSNQTAKYSVEKDGRAYLRFVHNETLFCIGKASLYTGLRYVKTEIKPQHGCYLILVTFDDGEELPKAPEKPKRIIGIDPGVDNLAAVVNNFGVHSFLIRGGAVKAANQWFNKKRASLLSAVTVGSDSRHSVKNSHFLSALSRKRDDLFRDIFYRAAWYICRFAVRHHTDVIVIGHNKDQKQKIRLGKQNNQSFVSIPFVRFKQILTNTAAKCGIPVIVQEESYTSKASVLDGDVIPTYGIDDDHAYFSGKRVKRGLYRSADGTFLNADVNGAANVIRKKYPDAFDGQNLKYLCKTTNVVKFTNLYPGAKSTCQEHYNGKRHESSPASKASHRYRKDTRLKYRILFGKSKYVYTSAKKSA